MQTSFLLSLLINDLKRILMLLSIMLLASLKTLPSLAPTSPTLVGFLAPCLGAILCQKYPLLQLKGYEQPLNALKCHYKPCARSAAYGKICAQNVLILTLSSDSACQPVQQPDS